MNGMDKDVPLEQRVWVYFDGGKAGFTDRVPTGPGAYWFKPVRSAFHYALVQAVKGGSANIEVETSQGRQAWHVTRHECQIA